MPSQVWEQKENTKTEELWGVWGRTSCSFTFSHSFLTFPLQFNVSFPLLLWWYFGVPPTSSLMLYYLLYLPCLGCAIAPSTSRFPSPMDAWFSLHFHLPPFFFPFYFTLLQLLFYNPQHPCPSLTPSLPAPWPRRLSPSRVWRQLLSGKVTLCVISAFHGSPLSLQRVIISFRVKGSICYKRTRASGIEGARVGVRGGEERRMELIGWERGRPVWERGDEGCK